MCVLQSNLFSTKLSQSLKRAKTLKVLIFSLSHCLLALVGGGGVRVRVRVRVWGGGMVSGMFHEQKKRGSQITDIKTSLS